MYLVRHKKVCQCASLTMWIGNPRVSRYSTAFSIFRPNDDCVHSSDAYSPTTRKEVSSLMDESVFPLRSRTAISQSLREPYTNVPVKVKRRVLNVMSGRGAQKGSELGFNASPTSQSVVPENPFRALKRSSRASSSIRASARDADKWRTISAANGFVSRFGYVFSKAYKVDISSSLRWPSAVSPRANPTNSATCRSSFAVNLCRGCNIMRACSQKNKRIVSVVCMKIPDFATEPLKAVG